MGDVGYVGTVRMRMWLRAFVMFCGMGRFGSFLVSFYTSLLGCFFLSLPSLFFALCLFRPRRASFRLSVRH